MDESAPILNGWRFRFVLGSVALSALAYVVFSLWAGWKDVYEATVRVGALTIIVSLVLSLLNYSLRFIRWDLYLSSLGHSLPKKEHFRIYISGFALTTTPGKAGEALRSVFLKRFKVSYTDSIAVLVTERFSDMLAVLLLTAFGISSFPEFKSLALIFLVATLGFMAFASSKRLVSFIRALFQGKSDKFSSAVSSICALMEQVRGCNSPSLLVSATLLSFIAWGAEAYAFHLILTQMGSDVTLSVSVFIYSISMLAGAASFMPGGLGGAEAAMTALLVGIGLSMPEAIAATVIIRLATLWFAVVLGALALSSNMAKYK